MTFQLNWRVKLTDPGILGSPALLGLSVASLPTEQKGCELELFTPKRMLYSKPPQKIGQSQKSYEHGDKFFSFSIFLVTTVTPKKT